MRTPRSMPRLGLCSRRTGLPRSRRWVNQSAEPKEFDGHSPSKIKPTPRWVVFLRLFQTMRTFTLITLVLLVLGMGTKRSQASYGMPKQESDSLNRPLCLLSWPDSLCNPVVLRNLMGNIPIETDCVQRPELYAMMATWVKYPYRYAGRTSKGIDCSGLVCEIQRKIYGRSYSGGSADIYPKLIKIPKDQLQEGDMVFFKIRKNKISHVGLYLGNQRFIHATTKAGVIVSSLDEDYYRRRYHGAGRDPKPPLCLPQYLPCQP